MKPLRLLRPEALEERQMLTAAYSVYSTRESVVEVGPKDILQSPERDGAKIVGGSVTDDDWPMMVSLANSIGHICGATRVARDAILTAAHCVEEQSVDDIRLTIGRLNLNSGGGDVLTASDIILHPDYVLTRFDPNDLDHEADIAVVLLDEPTTYQPVEIVRKNSVALTAPGKMATALVWGALEDTLFPTFPSRLHRVDVPIVSNEVANESYVTPISDRMLPAGATGKDTCEGDSGGPLLVQDENGQYFMAGVTSFGDGCGRPTFPGIYTRVSEFEEWLDPYVLPESAGRLIFDKQQYLDDDSARLTLRDTDLIGIGEQNVTLVSSSGDSEAVSLVETSDGVFTGSIALSHDAIEQNNGTLEVVPKGWLQAIYEDLSFRDQLPQTVRADATVLGDDHGNENASATQIGVGSVSDGEIELPLDQDRFSVQLVGGVQYEMFTELQTLDDSILAIYDHLGTVLLTNDDAGDTAASKVSWSPPADGQYFVEVSGFSESTGSYQLHVRESDSRDDHSNGPLQSTIVTSQETDGSIESDVDRDWFRFDAIAGDTYTIRVDTIGLIDSYLRLIDSDRRTELAFNDDVPNDTSSSLTWQAPRDGTFYFEITGWSGDTGSYIVFFKAEKSAVLGDFDNNRLANIQDVDLLCDAIRNQSDVPRFDINDDQILNRDDLDLMLTEAVDTVFGDVTGDGRFDSSDLVAVFARAEYEDNVDGNSNWSSGDWNCDGDFNTQDLVAVFQEATYRRD